MVWAGGFGIVGDPALFKHLLLLDNDALNCRRKGERVGREIGNSPLRLGEIE